MARLRGGDKLGGILAIVGSLLSGRTVFIGRRLGHGCGPHARTEIELIGKRTSRTCLRQLFGRLSHTPGRLVVLVGCIRLSN